MAHFSKITPEYLSNGHYRISDRDFMSIWTFKRKFNLPENTTSINGEEGQRLNSLGIEMHSSTPDFGGFSVIYIYPVDDLKQFYNL